MELMVKEMQFNQIDTEVEIDLLEYDEYKNYWNIRIPELRRDDREKIQGWWIKTNILPTEITATGQKIKTNLGMYIDARCMPQFHAVGAELGVRPVIHFNKDIPLMPGSQIKLGHYTWTVFKPGSAICDSITDIHCFSEDDERENANLYEYSDIKNYLMKWLEQEIQQKEEERKTLRDMYLRQCGVNN